jgi:hypothetical protein
MGAWGTGPFDNDHALDLVEEVTAPEFSFDRVQWAFDDPNYLGFDGGTLAIMLGALIQSVQGTNEAPHPDLDLGHFAKHVTPGTAARIGDT